MMAAVTISSDAGPAWVTGIPGVPGAVLMPEAAAGLRERKKVATRRALGLAAMRLAVDRGLDNVLVEDIAEAAGVSARTFNNYFASKYEAICALGFDRAMRIGAALRERPPGEPLWDAIVAAVMSEYGTSDRALDADWMAGVRLVTSTPALRGETPAASAMSSTRTLSRPRSTASRMAAIPSALRVATFLRSRSPAFDVVTASL